jgi:4-hydroxyphenylpyruvate dioxygenase
VDRSEHFDRIDINRISPNSLSTDIIAMATQTIVEDPSLTLHQSATNPISSSDAPISTYQGYDNVHWYVGNAKQAASYYITRMGFQKIAYRGLETGSRVVASHVVRNGAVTFVFTSPLHSKASKVDNLSEDDKELLVEIHDHLEQHGDAVRDVAFRVDDVDAVYSNAIKNGAKSIYPPKELSDSYGSARYARIRTYGDTTHTLIERKDYRGAFLPGFRPVDDSQSIDRLAKYLPEVKLSNIDHCVGNQGWDEMEEVCQ